MDEIHIKPANFDKAARYLQKLQGDGIWERTPESLRQRYRKQVEAVLNLCGLTLPGSDA